MPRVAKAPTPPPPEPTFIESLFRPVRNFLYDKVDPKLPPNSSIPFGQPISGTGKFIDFCGTYGGILPDDNDSQTIKIVKFVARAISCIGLGIISSLGSLYNLSLGLLSGGVWIVMNISKREEPFLEFDQEAYKNKAIGHLIYAVTDFSAFFFLKMTCVLYVVWPVIFQNMRNRLINVMLNTMNPPPAMEVDPVD